MRKIMLFFIVLSAICAVSSFSFAETKTVMAAGTFGASNIFLLGFYKGGNILYDGTSGVPFTSMDPSKSFVQSDGREREPSKSDIGLLVKTNLNQVWCLKIKGSAGALVSVGNIQYGLWQPWNSTLKQPADGEIAGGEGWHSIPTSPSVTYTAGNNDKSNLPFGTIATFNFAINPGRLDPTKAHQCIIQFTLTTTLS